MVLGVAGFEPLAPSMKQRSIAVAIEEQAGALQLLGVE